MTAPTLFAACATAQCPSIDFEIYSPGAPITTQYAGVTFSAEPGSCGGGTPTPIIVAPAGGTSSGARALGIGGGCPDFSPDLLRMVFDDEQRFVTFMLGEQVSTNVTFEVRAYTDGGALLSSQSVVVGAGVHRYVTVGSMAGPANIRRIDVDSPIDLFETIDDLTFDIDTTPPEVRIDSPTYGACGCDVPGTVTDVVFTGITCDYDGGYDRDRLEVKPVGAAPGTPWTLVREYVGSPVCEAFPLYNWDVEEVPHGTYYARITATNACGLTASDTTVVHVDKQFDEVTIDAPADGGTVCGTVAIAGTVRDRCGGCFDEYVVEYIPTSGGGVYQPVDPAHPTYSNIVMNGTLAEWNTVALGIPDGEYKIRVIGTDVCGNTQVSSRNVQVNNAAGCVCPDLDGDGMIGFGDLIRLLSIWDQPCP